MPFILVLVLVVMRYLSLQAFSAALFVLYPSAHHRARHPCTSASHCSTTPRHAIRPHPGACHALFVLAGIRHCTIHSLSKGLSSCCSSWASAFHRSMTLRHAIRPHQRAIHPCRHSSSRCLSYVRAHRRTIHPRTRASIALALVVTPLALVLAVTCRAVHTYAGAHHRASASRQLDICYCTIRAQSSQCSLPCHLCIHQGFLSCQCPSWYYASLPWCSS
jgi:hypothetical protein